MTTFIEYARTGRRLIFAHSLWNAASEWSDGDLTWGDLTAGIYLGASTIALWIPDPAVTALGYVATRTYNFAGAPIVKPIIKWWRGLSAIRRFGVAYILLMPIQILIDQSGKANTGAPGWTEQHGNLDYQAISMPGTERTVAPIAANPFAGIGRTF